MANVATVLGLMSGTSMDGVDLALLQTDGEGVVKRLAAGFHPYDSDLRADLRGVLGKSDDAGGGVAAAARAVTQAHIVAARAFLRETGVRPDLTGFHGQTIFHDPAHGRTWQIGDARALADALRTPVVCDFRSNDMRHGGQGAPLLPLYHRALMRAAGLAEPACVLNLGGVGNITWMRGETLIACDTGPGNALLDDWMLAQTGTPMDEAGRTAQAGRPEPERLDRWLAHPYFAAPAPKSLDRNAFETCSVQGLSLADGAATLAAFTVRTVLAALRLMPAMPHILVVSGGGRHNAALMQGLAAHVETVSADALGWRGDALEAEGFAYLAQRAVRGLPLSLPSTTGCSKPVSGGVLVRPDADNPPAADNP